MRVSKGLRTCVVFGSGWNQEIGITMTLSVSLAEKNRLVVGYTTRSHLLLDLDETSRLRAEGLAGHIIGSWPEIGDVLIMESSTPSKREYWKGDGKGIPHHRWVYQNYHLVSDNNIGYSKCCDIIETLVELDVLQKEYRDIRMFRGDMTLRISPKVLMHRVIPAPKPLTLIHNCLCKRHDGMIDHYLDLLTIVESLASGYGSGTYTADAKPIDHR